MIAAHFAAIQAQLSLDPVLASRLFDTERRDADGNLIRDTYVILYGGGPDALDEDRFTAAQRADSTAEFVYTVRSVSPIPSGVRETQSRVLAQLAGAVVSVNGRLCDAIKLTHSTVVAADTSINPPLMFADDEYTLISRRA